VERADLVVIGAQECEFKTSTADYSCQDEWVHALSVAIGDAHVLVRVDMLGQMRLAIWAQLKVVAGITAQATDSVATGVC
jgi:hypothetical protein